MLGHERPLIAAEPVADLSLPESIMRPSILTSLAAAVVLIPGLATAALAQSSQSRVVAQSPQQAAAETQAALRALVVAEERYFAAHVTYTTDLVALAPQPKPAGVYLIVTHAG